MDDQETYYQVLGVPETATLDEIKKAYNRLAQQFHPDKVSEAAKGFPWIEKEANERTARINDAKRVLTDRAKRQQYDENLKAIRLEEQTSGDAAKTAPEPFNQASTNWAGTNPPPPPPPPPPHPSAGHSAAGPPPLTPTAAPTPLKKNKLWYAVKATLVWVVIIGTVCLGSVLLRHWASGAPVRFFWSGPAIPPPPDLNCDGWVDLDAQHAEDHSKDDMDKPVYIKTVPVAGSEQKLCWSTWVVLPPYKVEWHVKFLNEDPVKDHCVAYVKYEGIARVFGPYTGTVDIGESNMPKNNGFRLATRCKVYAYGE